MKKFLVAASLLVSVASAAHDGEEAPRVIPGSGDRNARFVIKGKEIDACRLAVEISDKTRDLVDQLEPRMLYGPPKNVSPEKTDEWMLETQALLNSAQTHYGALEIASAVCVGREVNKDRLPHVSAQSSASHDLISGTAWRDELPLRKYCRRDPRPTASPRSCSSAPEAKYRSASRRMRG